MIPKIIHFCWLSGKPYPKQIKQCIESWSKNLPDYEIRKWDFSRFSKYKSAWVSEAASAKKWAYAADYIRNYALFTEGGIYLDSDCEVIRDFDDMLHLPYFFGYRNGTDYIDVGIMASEAGNPMFKQILDFYEGKHFYDDNGMPHIIALPSLINTIWGKNYNLTPVDSPEEFGNDPNRIYILPSDILSPVNVEQKKMCRTHRTRCIHHFASSWATGWPKYRRILNKLIGSPFRLLNVDQK